MTARGGQQRIPRPPTVRAGRPAPWSALDPAMRVMRLSDVRERAERLPAPKQPALIPVTSRPAAVLIPIFEEHGEARVILTRRPESMPSHRGDIAFPGGGFKDGQDLTLTDTALREAHEEIGLAPDYVDVVAELDTLGTVGAPYTITPFLGLIDQRPTLVAQSSEVERIFDVSLADLLADGVHHEERWEMGAPRWDMHFFELEDETIWGATARILTVLLTHLTRQP